MNYIINPMWFYWLGVVDELRGFFAMAAILVGIAEIVMGILALVNYEFGKGFGPDNDDMKTAKALIKPIIICGVVLIVSLIGIVFVPTKNTLIEMQVARYATYENVEWTVDAVKSAVDYIVNAIAKVNGG